VVSQKNEAALEVNGLGGGQYRKGLEKVIAVVENLKW
jgi:hypothetical protein